MSLQEMSRFMTINLSHNIWNFYHISTFVTQHDENTCVKNHAP